MNPNPPGYSLETNNLLLYYLMLIIVLNIPNDLWIFHKILSDIRLDDLIYPLIILIVFIEFNLNSDSGWIGMLYR